MRHIGIRICALLLSCAIGVAAYVVLSRSETLEMHIESVLIPCRHYSPYGFTNKPDIHLIPCESFMALERDGKWADVNEPLTGRLFDPYMIEHNCGTLYLTISNDGTIRLNSTELGTLANIEEIRMELNRVFDARIRNRAFLEGMEERNDLPVSERIQATVLVGAACSVKYGEVRKVINAVKASSARLVVLQTKDCDEVGTMFDAH